MSVSVAMARIHAISAASASVLLTRVGVDAEREMPVSVGDLERRVESVMQQVQPRLDQIELRCEVLRHRLEVAGLATAGKVVVRLHTASPKYAAMTPGSLRISAGGP